MVKSIVDEIMNLTEEERIYIYNHGALGWILSSKLSGIFVFSLGPSAGTRAE